MKSLYSLLSGFSMIVVVIELCGLGWLWWHGTLTGETYNDVRTVLLGGDPAVERAAEEEAEAPQPSLDEVINARARQSAEFDAKATELGVVKEMMTQEAAQLAIAQQAFEEKKKAFEKELQTLQDKVSGAGVEQARGVLLAMSPKDAADKLMQVPTDEAVALLKGMTEKSIAKILKEFKNDPKQVERGKELFEQLAHGEPRANLANVAPTEPAPAAPAPPPEAEK